MFTHPNLRMFAEVREQLRLNKIYQGLRVSDDRPRYIFHGGKYSRHEINKLPGKRKIKSVHILGLKQDYRPIFGASPADYHVKNGGDDGKDGLSDANAWATTGKVNGTSLIAGDEVRFKCGSTWTNADLNTLYGGSAGNPITYTKYGSGNLPLFAGSSPSPWVAISDYGASSQSYITIEYLEIKDYDDQAADGRGFHMVNTDHLTIRYCVVHNHVVFGMIINNNDYGEIYGNTVYSNGDNGIWIEGDYVDVYDNTVYDNASNGIGSSRCDYGKWHHNICYANSTGGTLAGIGLEVEASNHEVYYNLLYDNHHAGVVLNAENNTVYNNTFYNNGTNGGGCQLNLSDWTSSAPANTIAKNNIFCFPSGNARGVYLLDNGAVAWTGLDCTFDYNLYCVEGGPDQDPMVTDTTQEPEVDYTFATWVSSAGKEANGLCVDPKFMDAANDDYRLKSDSPCIDAGTSVGLEGKYDLDGRLIRSGDSIDMGCYQTLKGGPRRL